MKVHCVVCGKQAIDENVPCNDLYLTTLKNGRIGFFVNEVYCGYCAIEMDENGLFPEEKYDF